jgi:hypothetical protein
MNKMEAFVTRFFLLLFPLIFFVSCGFDSSTGTPPLSAEEFCRQGWEYYENTEYIKAIDSFDAAIGLKDTWAEGFIGKGWTYIRLNAWPNAYAALFLAEERLTAIDLRLNVGRAIVALFYNDHQTIVDLLSDHIQGTDHWVHNHDSSIDAVDLHNLLAEAYILQHNYGDETTSEVNELSAWGQVKKSLELNPADTKALELQSYLRERI